MAAERGPMFTAMAGTSQSPIVGVTLDSEQAGGYSKFPWYAVRQNYMSSLKAAGALPVADYDRFDKTGSNGYRIGGFYFDFDVFTRDLISIESNNTLI